MSNPLDIWIVSRMAQLRDEITEGMESYNIPNALAGVLPFVDDLSKWFVRRSRRRFWKSEDDSDKKESYEVLHYVLTELALLLAPFTPFLAEELWLNLVGEGSVHLQDWPESCGADKDVLAEMERCRYVITEGLARRMDTQDDFGQIKIRQPLAKLEYGGEKLGDFYEKIVMEEVNVKTVGHDKGLDGIRLDKKLTKELKDEGFVRELIRFVQAARKKAGLNVDDRIRLSINIELPEESLKDILMAEVLAVDLVKDGNFGYDEIVKVADQNIVISLEKA